MNIFNSVKKAEIHVHLEATITPSICKKFADRNNHKIPDDFNAVNSDFSDKFPVIIIDDNNIAKGNARGTRVQDA